MSYNYKNSKSNIINILNSDMPITEADTIPSDQEFTYDNGVLSLVSAIFVDIKKSSLLFKDRDEKLARLLRAFTSELITIFQDFDKHNQIGIRGDCVYAIYSTPQKSDVKSVFSIAIKVNTFMKMFNKLLTKYGYSNIGVGIGLGCDKELIIKAGRTGTGINDKIWIGKAVVDAANLSSVANRHNFSKIAMNDCFYANIKKFYKDEDLFHRVYNFDYFDDVFYECNIVEKQFNNWINEGM